ncbi:MAG: response regulator [Prochlorococcaceae cyanobacterium]
MNPAHPATVLLVEDRALLERVSVRSLNRYGFAVISSSSAEEALATIRNDTAIDIVLMDIDLGLGMNGLEAARRIRSLSDVPILFHSSREDRESLHFTLLGPAVDLALSTHHAFELYKLTREYEKNRLVHGEQALAVCALCDTNLRYTWINDPHPDFSVEGYLGKTDLEISANPGMLELYALKQEALTTGRTTEKDILFPLQNTHLLYHVSAAPMHDLLGELLGGKTISFAI